MENRIVNTKIKTFERLFRSLKYRQDGKNGNLGKSPLKNETEEEFCKEVGELLEEIKKIQRCDWLADTAEQIRILKKIRILEQTEISEPIGSSDKIETPEQTEILVKSEFTKQSGNSMQNFALNWKVNAGQYIILAGPIGLAGTMLMAKYFSEELSSVFPTWLLRDALGMEEQLHLYPYLTRELLDKYNISVVYPVGEGGLRRTLYQLGKDTGMGYEIQARHVPVNQITIEICEHFDLDPWSLLSVGCTLMICSHPAGLIQELKKQKIQSEVIGIMMDNNDKVITYGSTRSLVNRPKADELLKIWLERFIHR